jgi:hypothetical protein
LHGGVHGPDPQGGGIPPETGAKLFAALSATNHLADEVDGLTINSAAGTFSYRRIPGWLVIGGLGGGKDGLFITWLFTVPEAGPGTAPVTTRSLREIKATEILNEIRRRLLPVDEATRAAYRALVGKEPYWPEPKVGRAPVTPRRTDDAKTQARLRRVARAYISEMDTPGVHERLAQRFRTTPEQIKAEIRNARADGWLAPARHGTRGGGPGPRLLAEIEKGDG